MKRCVALILIGIVVGMMAGCPAREPKHQPGELVGQLPGTPPPGVETPATPAGGDAAQPGTAAEPTKAPANGAIPLAAPHQDAGKPTATPLTEDLFVAISAKMVLASKTVPDNEAGRKQLEDYTTQVLRETGVSVEDFQSFTNHLQHDDARRKMIADRILARAREYASPQVRAKLKVVPPEKANAGGQ